MSKPEMNVVYMRTVKGQALSQSRRAFPDERSHVVLRLVNGYTPADCLIDLAQFSIPDAQIRLEDLEQRGLIERVNTSSRSLEQLKLFSARSRKQSDRQRNAAPWKVEHVDSGYQGSPRITAHPKFE